MRKSKAKKCENKISTWNIRKMVEPCKMQEVATKEKTEKVNMELHL